MGAVPAITQVQGGKRQYGQGIIATGQKLDEACINQEGVSQHNGDDKRTCGDVLIKVTQGRPEGENKPNIGTPSQGSKSRWAACSQ